MTVFERLEAFSNFSINSMEELEQLINREEEKVEKTLNEYYPPELKKFEEYLDLGELFKKTHWNSLGFTVCQEVVKGVDAYHRLLQDSLTVCQEVLTEALIPSFKCHQQAFECFVKNRQLKEATSAMALTKRIAKQITIRYENLADNFFSLESKKTQDICSSIIEQNKIKKELEAKQNENILVDSTKSNNFPLYEAIKGLKEIQQNLLKVEVICGDASDFSEGLEDPPLADPLVVEALMDSKPEDAPKVSTEENIEKYIKKRELSEFVMKTGRKRKITVSESSSHSFVKYIKFPIKLDEKFEDSYIQWLALAKINLTLIKALQAAIPKVEQSQKHISAIEHDFFVKALHQAVSNSEKQEGMRLE